MADDENKPYCIWYPDLASEDTYRELVRRYPDMRYHVGRACAAAGYTSLYKELDLLPEVSIAEEARDNKQSGASIFEHIMSQPVRYKVLNDYTRTANLENPEAGVHMNGDTAVRSTLSGVVKHEHDPLYKHYFDIQEDERVGEPGDPSVYQTLENEHVSLFYSPLPRDLPTINKDVLIIMAAWDGNFERYARLRRPCRIANEISAGEYLPLVFWWPHRPKEDTLRELAWRRSDLKDHVAVACIVANYQEVFDELQAEPSRRQWEVACQSPNTHYRESVERRAAEQDVDFVVPQDAEFFHGIPGGGWRKPYLEFELEGSGRAAIPDALVNTSHMHFEDPYGWEDEWFEPGHLLDYHLELSVMAWNTYICATDEARKTPGPLYSSDKDFERRRSRSCRYPSWPKELESHYGSDADKWY
ncbi:hypothetical protein CPLU01_15963 [Colletotrichum plurivorum]|uniref:Uncharacterized protein n=1 Tax=Colletotrichum plurivorum TaxID=2175906 RepID=A0A8H6MRQ5_9PEZI|nr:hypothetical protein CPLU01_15963 [Colletotrichum plurivorum]